MHRRTSHGRRPTPNHHLGLSVSGSGIVSIGVLLALVLSLMGSTGLPASAEESTPVVDVPPIATEPDVPDQPTAPETQPSATEPVIPAEPTATVVPALPQLSGAIACAARGDSPLMSQWRAQRATARNESPGVLAAQRGPCDPTPTVNASLYATITSYSCNTLALETNSAVFLEISYHNGHGQNYASFGNPHPTFRWNLPPTFSGTLWITIYVLNSDMTLGRTLATATVPDCYGPEVTPPPPSPTPGAVVSQATCTSISFSTTSNLIAFVTISGPGGFSTNFLSYSGQSWTLPVGFNGTIHYRIASGTNTSEIWAEGDVPNCVGPAATATAMATTVATTGPAPTLNLNGINGSVSVTVGSRVIVTTQVWAQFYVYSDSSCSTVIPSNPYPGPDLAFIYTVPTTVYFQAFNPASPSARSRCLGASWTAALATNTAPPTATATVAAPTNTVLPTATMTATIAPSATTPATETPGNTPSAPSTATATLTLAAPMPDPTETMTPAPSVTATATQTASPETPRPSPTLPSPTATTSPTIPAPTPTTVQSGTLMVSVISADGSALPDTLFICVDGVCQELQPVSATAQTVRSARLWRTPSGTSVTITLDPGEHRVALRKGHTILQQAVVRIASGTTTAIRFVYAPASPTQPPATSQAATTPPVVSSLPTTGSGDGSGSDLLVTVALLTLAVMAIVSACALRHRPSRPD